jgi:DNA-binding protein HU-beta
MAMTKSEIAAALAEQVGITKRQAKAFFEAQAALAYEQAKDQFVIPGIGKLKLADKPARDMKMTVGPLKGQTKRIEKSKKLKFLFARSAKEAILGTKKSPVKQAT